MRLLLDESVPRRLRNALPAHTVKTAVEMGWGGNRMEDLVPLVPGILKELNHIPPKALRKIGALQVVQPECQTASLFGTRRASRVRARLTAVVGPLLLPSRRKDRHE
jgi:hypothetical protein